MIFVEPSVASDSGKIYLDIHDTRICYTPASSGGGGGQVLTHESFLGISSTNPADTWPKVNNQDVPNPPNDGDWVAYGTKEYYYCATSTDNWKWKEFGDENAEGG